MVAERLINRQEQSTSYDNFERRSNIALANEREMIENFLRLDLTNMIVPHVRLNSLHMLPKEPIQLLSRIPSYQRLNFLQKLNDEDSKELFIRVFAATLSRSWNMKAAPNLDVKEQKLIGECAELKEKGYSLEKVLRETSEHFHLPLRQVMEIASMQYFTVKDIAKHLEINQKRAAKILTEAANKDSTIIRENLKYEHDDQLMFVPKNQWDKVIKAIKATVHSEFTLPDGQKIKILSKGKVQIKIMEMFLSQDGKFNLESLFSLYPDTDKASARRKAQESISKLKKKLRKVGWTIENQARVDFGFYKKGKAQEKIYVLKSLSADRIAGIDKKKYFTIDSMARKLEMNRGSAKNRIMEAIKKDPTIKLVRLEGNNRIFIHREHWDNVKASVEALIQKSFITLPDGKIVAINGRLKKKIIDMLLDKVNKSQGLSLPEIIALYPKGDKDARVKAHHVIEDLKKTLQASGWTIKNKYISRGSNKKHISEYFLKKKEAVIAESSIPEITTQQPQPEVKKEAIIFELKDVKPEFDPKLYTVPKGEKPFYSLLDIAGDLGAKKTDVKNALARLGIKKH